MFWLGVSLILLAWSIEGVLLSDKILSFCENTPMPIWFFFIIVLIAILFCGPIMWIWGCFWFVMYNIEKRKR